MRQCPCGCTRFFAHQVQRHEVIISADGPFAFWEGQKPDSCYDTETPYGPFQCEQCGREFEELEDIPDDEEGEGEA